MGGFVKGDIVVVPFPFSDLSDAKRRPALIIASLYGDDLILCQITSQHIKDSYSIPISDEDITGGSLKKESNIRPNRIFTADSGIVLYKIGALKNDHTAEVINKIIEIIEN